jgi:hypothetical protein
MNLKELLVSPPPATGWSLDVTMAAVVRRQAKTELRCAAVEVPEGTFEIGPVGLQSIDEDKLRPVLTRLQGEVEGSHRAAVVVPTGWLRTHLFEFEELPRRQADVHDMVLWRLKKMLPVAPSSLRLATVAQPPVDGSRQLLVMVGVERAIASLEAVFESIEVSPGLITPRVFALANKNVGQGTVLNIQQEGRVLALVLLVDGSPRVVRTKPLAGRDWSVLERELNLTLGFIAKSLGIEGGITVGVSAEDDQLADRLAMWVVATDGLTLTAAEPPSLVFEGTAVRDRVGAFRLDPVVNIMSGAIR